MPGADRFFEDPTEYDRVMRMLSDLAESILGGSRAQDSENDVAEAILRMFLGRGTFDPQRGEFDQWAKQVLRNVIFSRKKAHVERQRKDALMELVRERYAAGDQGLGDVLRAVNEETGIGFFRSAMQVVLSPKGEISPVARRERDTILKEILRNGSFAAYVRRCAEQGDGRASRVLRYNEELRVLIPNSLDRPLHEGSDNPVTLLDRVSGVDPTEEVDPIRTGHVEHCKDALRNELRQVIVMHYDEELPLSEVARLMGRNSNTVRSWHARALESIRKCLAAYGYPGDAL